MSLAQSHREIAEVQKRTEQRLEELAEAQKKTEQKLDALIEVVRDIDNRLNRLTDEVKILSKNVTILTKSHINLKEMVGGLSHTVGYRLEDDSYKVLPKLLHERMSIEVVGRFKRDYVEIAKDKYMEINIIGKARYAVKECVIVGEAKTQLKRKDVDDFIKKADELKKISQR